MCHASVPPHPLTRCPYLAYGKLKKALKGKAGPPQTFPDRLRAEMAKVSCFVQENGQHFMVRWLAVQQEMGERRQEWTRQLYAGPSHGLINACLFVWVCACLQNMFSPSPCW